MNDANAAAAAEWWVGAGRSPDIKNLVLVTLGTGIGGGVVLNGRLVEGSFGSAGEVGHSVVFHVVLLMLVDCQRRWAAVQLWSTWLC